MSTQLISIVSQIKGVVPTVNGGTGVSDGLMPIIPDNAVQSPLLDSYSGHAWNSTHDSGTPGTSTGTTTYVDAVNGRNFNMSYTANGGQRFSLWFATDTSYPQNFCYDIQINFDDPSQVLNMELDMNQVLADGRTVIFDCQCASGSGSWERDAWHASRIVGNPQQWGAGVWNRIRIFWHRSADGNTTTWDGVEFNGSYLAFAAATANTAQSLGWTPVGLLLINFQIEGSSATSGTVNCHARNMTVWRW